MANKARSIDEKLLRKQGREEMAGQPSWWDRVPSWIQALAVVIALVLTLQQLRQINDQIAKTNQALESNASATIFDQQLVINKLFLEGGNHKLVPYFFEGKRIPPEETEVRQKADQVAGSVLDFFSHLEDQQEAGAFKIDEGWGSYIRSSFEKSPVLCETLRDNIVLYGGYCGLLWDGFADQACACWLADRVPQAVLSPCPGKEP
jgi:hypothetical protein